MQEIKKVVLAYSGGLDTSVIIPWLKENYDNWRSKGRPLNGRMMKEKCRNLPKRLQI